MSRCQEALEHLPDLFIHFDLCHSDHTKLHFPHFLGGLALPVPSWSGVKGGVAGKESRSCSGGMRGVIFSVNKLAGVRGDVTHLPSPPCSLPLTHIWNSHHRHAVSCFQGSSFRDSLVVFIFPCLLRLVLLCEGPRVVVAGLFIGAPHPRLPSICLRSPLGPICV